jgi:hypothetical protein
MESKCIAEYTIDRQTNPWQGFTGSYAEEEASKTVKAGEIDGKEFAPLPSLARFTINGTVLIGRSEKKRQVILNGKYFSEFKRGDATRGDPKPEILGTYKDKGFKLLPPRQLVEFLLYAHLVTTYWHIESNLCLTKEESNEASYKAFFSGSHTYFTNNKNTDPLSFSIAVDMKSGQVTLERT